ncbi:MAG: HGxxPAAW family protein [Actinomycetota bacterium]
MISVSPQDSVDQHSQAHRRNLTHTSSPTTQHSQEHHGGSLAAWTCVVFVIVGSAVMSGAVIAGSVVWFVVGAVVIALGGVAGKLLQLAGHGAEPMRPPGQPAHE